MSDNFLNEYTDLKVFCDENHINYNKLYKSLLKKNVKFSPAFGRVFVANTVLKEHVFSSFVELSEKQSERRAKAKERMLNAQNSKRKFETVINFYENLKDTEKNLIQEKFSDLSKIIETSTKGNGLNPPTSKVNESPPTSQTKTSKTPSEKPRETQSSSKSDNPKGEDEISEVKFSFDNLK